MARTPKCPDCGHTAAEHREGRSACRAVVRSKWNGAKQDQEPPTATARWSWYGWECGCKKRRSEIEGLLGPVCEHCNGTGHKQPA